MRRLVSDTAVIAQRNLLRLPRQPELLLAFTIQPIMFVLLFRYVFGGAIRTPGYLSYADFLIPGIIVQNIAFGGFTAAIGLNEDMSKGLIDRFRSLPMSRAAGPGRPDAVGRVLEPALGRDPGYHRDHHRFLVPHRRPASGCRAGPTAAVRLRLLVGLRLGGPARALARGGQLGRLHRRLPAYLYLVGVVPVRFMPSVLRAFADVNPFTIVVNAMRSLWLGSPAATTSGRRCSGRSRSSPCSPCSPFPVSERGSAVRLGCRCDRPGLVRLPAGAEPASATALKWSVRRGVEQSGSSSGS